MPKLGPRAITHLNIYKTREGILAPPNMFP